MGGTVVSAARIVPALGTVPEYCLVQGIMEERNNGVAGIAGLSARELAAQETAQRATRATPTPKINRPSVR